jgi:hypothetical protein
MPILLLSNIILNREQMKKKYLGMINKQKNIVFIFFLFICLVSCEKKTNLESIFGQVKNINCKELQTEDLLSNPTDLNVIGGNIIYEDFIDDKMVAVYNIDKNQIIHRIFTIGQGPDDLLAPIQLNVDNNENRINILQRQSGTYTQYDINDLLAKNITPLNKVDFENIDRITVTDNGFIATGFYKEGIIGIYDKNGILKNIVDIYPDYCSKIENIETKYKIGQGRIHYNKKMQLFVFGSTYTGEMNFFKLSANNELTLIKSYSENNLNFKNRISNNSRDIPILKTDILYCMDICSSKEYIYILYYGESILDKKNAKFSYILKFDSMGNAIDCYKTNYHLSAFGVDEDENMYGSSLSENLDPVFVEIKYNTNEK